MVKFDKNYIINSLSNSSNLTMEDYEEIEKISKDFSYYLPSKLLMLLILKNNDVIEYYKKLNEFSIQFIDRKFLKKAIEDIQKLRSSFYKNVIIPGDKSSYNESLCKAMRLADFLELGELFAMDALKRNESCGGHFREEFQTKEGEALRMDDNFSFVSAWENNGDMKLMEFHLICRFWK